MVSESAAFAMYQNGELDTVVVPESELDRVRADPVLSKELINLYNGIVGLAKPYLERTAAFAGGEHVWKWKVKAH